MITKATVVAATAAILAGCSTSVETVMNDVHPGNWSNCTVIGYDNRDTVSLRDISLVVRYNADRHEATLPLTITTEAPDSTLFSEQFVCRLGLGRKPAPIAAIEKIPYRLSSRLSQTGRYSISITPDTPQRGIEAIGITFEPKE